MHLNRTAAPGGPAGWVLAAPFVRNAVVFKLWRCWQGWARLAPLPGTPGQRQSHLGLVAPGGGTVWGGQWAGARGRRGEGVTGDDLGVSLRVSLRMSLGMSLMMSLRCP